MPTICRMQKQVQTTEFLHHTAVKCVWNVKLALKYLYFLSQHTRAYNTLHTEKKKERKSQTANLMVTVLNLVHLILSHDYSIWIVAYFPFFHYFSSSVSSLLYLSISLTWSWLSVTLNSVVITIIRKNYFPLKVYVTGYQEKRLKNAFYIGITSTMFMANLWWTIFEKQLHFDLLSLIFFSKNST